MRPESLQELADSIRAQGVVQPIVVRPLKTQQAGEPLRYEIIAGERRWRAAQMAGLHDIPAVIRLVPDEAAVAMSLGLFPRVATATTFAVVAYNLFLSTTHFHNNRAYLVIVLGVLAVAPCGRELSLDAWIRRRRGRPPRSLSAPAWPL